MRRQLSKEERAISQKQILLISKRNDYLDYQVDYQNLMIEKGLKLNYIKQLGEYKDVLSKTLEEKNLNDNKIKILTEQIQKGVEIKKKGGEK